MEEYLFKRLDKESYNFIQELYSKSFNLKESLSYIRHKYDTSYTGVVNIGYLAFSQTDAPAAYYGVFPMILSSGEKDILVAQSGDTMTAPDHRGKGLFVKLAQMTYQLAWEEQVKLVFGFPNENSFPGFKKKLNWEFHGTMQRFTFTNSAFPACEISSKNKAISGIYQPLIRVVINKYKLPLAEDDISSFKDPVTHSGIKKDLHFFKYKLLNQKNHLIRMNGFSLLIKADPHLMVGAVSYFEKERIGEFQSTLKHLATMLGCRKTQITVSKNHWLFPYLLDFQQPEESLPIGFLQPASGFPLTEIAFTLADFDTF